MRSLPIEKDSDLLKEFGRCIAYVTLLEDVIEQKFGKIVPKLAEDVTLGQKINLIQSSITSDVKKRLCDINKKRNALCHKLVLQHVVIDSGKQEQGHLFVKNKKRLYSIDADFFKEFINDSNRIIDELRK